jgi:hypothetical protein
MKTIEKFLAGSALGIRCREVSVNGDRESFGESPWVGKRYRCELLGANGHRPITTTIDSQNGPPGVADVLDAIAAEAAMVEASDCFEAWAVQMGFDPDSRYGERVYRAARRQANGLRGLLGESTYYELLWETKRL